MTSDKRELMRKGADLKPTVHVGKGGITDNLLEEIKRQIKDHQLIKIRLLPSSGSDMDATAYELAERSQTTVLEVRGNTVLLCDTRVFE